MLERLRPLAGQLLRRMGYQAVRLEALPKITFAWHLKHLLTSQQIETVVDVGANRGQYRDFLRHEAAFSGRILSFEPVAHLHRELQSRAASDPQWQVYPFAAGEAADTLAINVMQADTWSSFLQPQMEDGTRFAGHNTVDRTESVQVVRLDHVLPGFGPLGRWMLKLDTQGFDLKALRGAEAIVREAVAVQTEAVVLPYYAAMPTYADVIRHLEGCGFALSGMFPVSHDERLRLIEFDCVMVNPSRVIPDSD